MSWGCHVILILLQLVQKIGSDVVLGHGPSAVRNKDESRSRFVHNIPLLILCKKMSEILPVGLRMSLITSEFVQGNQSMETGVINLGLLNGYSSIYRSHIFSILFCGMWGDVNLLAQYLGTLKCWG